jgi:hypothetical protein
LKKLTKNNGEQSKIKAVEIHAELRQIRTMADGTVNVILNLPEYCIPQAKIMMDWLKELLHCVIELGPDST